MSRTFKSFKTAVLVAALLTSQAATAQQPGSNSLFSATPSTGLILPAPRGRSDVFAPGGPLGSSTQSPLPAPETPAPNSAGAASPTVPAGQVELALSARFGKDAAPIGGGLTWRVYAAKPETGGGYKLVKEDKSPAP